MDFVKFIASYKTAKDTGEFIQKHIKKQYLPYGTKLALAQSIAKNCTHIEINGKSIYKKDTPSQYFTVIMQLVSQYTDITFDNNTVVKAYDALSEVGALNSILSAIPESEVTEFRTLVDMCVSDIYDNERDLTSFLETKIDAAGMVGNQVLESLKEVIPQLKDLEQDEKKDDFPMNDAE